VTDHGLSGRVALVTGASGGIGAAISRVLAGAGATVALGYSRNSERAEQLASELDGSAAFGADLEDPEAPARLMVEVGERLVETEILPGDPAELGKRIPIGRVGRPEEVAEVALAVLTNGFITSKVFPIDGGMYPR
jgi:NAD(P)-dependent dehydrogenase (short-subunit alcohol dehydrogenase family)